MADGVAWTCPRCGQAYTHGPDADGMLTCPTGHRAYSGYVAEAEALRARVAWLDARVAEGDARPDDDTARSYGIWPASPPPDLAASGTDAVSPAPSPAVTAEPHPAGAQLLLLGLGAALLILAAIVFTAVVWDQLGALGKVGLMAVVTVGCGLLAIRLRPRLAGTAEALAVVTFGLAVVDVVASPALGLVPDEWVYPDRLYLAVTCAAVGWFFAWLGRSCRLRAWSWFGWVAVALAAGLFTWWLMAEPMNDQPWRGLALAPLMLSAVGLFAASYVVPTLEPDRHPTRLAAAVAGVLSVFTLPAALFDLDRPAFLGTAVALLVVAGAVLWLGRLTGSVVWRYVSVTLVGAAAGLLLLMLPETESVWPAVVVAVVGAVVLLALSDRGMANLGLVASGVAWVTWGLGRLAVTGPASMSDPVYLQLAVVLLVAALAWWVVAARGHEPGLAWAAAVVAELGWLCLLPRLGLPDVPEAGWLPFGVFLLVGGWIWHRRAGGKSLAWLAPGVAVTLLPSAVVCWAAPWVYPFSEQSTGEALARLLLVIAASLAVVMVGLAWRLAGLLVPGAVALAVVGLAQVWSGAQAMPRWIAIGVAGVLLIVLGARVEWLRNGGRRARDYLDDLA